MLSEAKHLDFLSLCGQVTTDQRFFSRSCGIGVTFAWVKSCFRVIRLIRG
jgi:hypothetical protein